MKTYEKREDGNVIIRETKPVETSVNIATLKREIEDLERQKSDNEIAFAEYQSRTSDIQSQIDERKAIIKEIEGKFPEMKEVTADTEIAVDEDVKNNE